MGSDVRLFLWNKHAGDPSGPAGVLVPQEQTDIAALLGPVLLAAHDGGGRNGLVHCGTPRSRRVTLVYWITSSARASSRSGTSSPSAFAVLRLITNSSGRL